MVARRSRPCPPSDATCAGPKSGVRTRRRADLLADLLELAAPNVGEILAHGTRRRALVEEHGNAELLADALAERAREGDALLHRRALERNEGHDIGGAHARMRAASAW